MSGCVAKMRRKTKSFFRSAKAMPQSYRDAAREASRAHPPARERRTPRARADGGAPAGDRAAGPAWINLSGCYAVATDMVPDQISPRCGTKERSTRGSARLGPAHTT